MRGAEDALEGILINGGCAETVAVQEAEEGRAAETEAEAGEEVAAGHREVDVVAGHEDFVHRLITASSWFNKASARTVPAARSTGETVGWLAVSPTASSLAAACWSPVNISRCSAKSCLRTASSCAVGRREATRRKAQVIWSASEGPPSWNMRWLIKRAASTICVSLSRQSAWRGVLVLWRLARQTLCSGASNEIIAGGGTVRFQKV